ncbi:MAG: PEGA domain-containing protein [Clostridia bacterium]|jgi:hypothetical protein
MPSSVRLVWLLTLLLLISPARAFLQAQSSLTVGWAELDVASLDEDLARVGVLLPKALMEATSFIKERYMLQTEAVESSLKTMNAEQEAARNAVAVARKKRDLVSISIRDPAKRATELRTAQATLDTAVETLDQLVSGHKGLQDDTPPPVSPLLRWNGHEDGSLLPPKGVPALVCAEKKLDLLVHGWIESIDSYLVAELVLYSATTNEEVWKATGYAAIDDLDGLVSSMDRSLATALAGRDFSRIHFDISPDSAEILLDGKVYPGEFTLFHSQDSFPVTVSAAGYRSVSTRVAVVPGKDTTVTLSLEPIQEAPVFVESFPSGASLYLDGTPLGVTPLELAGVAYPRVLTARLDGYDDLKLVVRPGSEAGRVVLDLQASDGLAYKDKFEQAKGAFYQSLGWLIVSLPVTVLSYGTFNSYLSLAPLPSTVSGQTVDRLTVYYLGSRTVFWISAAVSASLATNSIVRLVRYIKAAR